jgi:hypothetical protein
MKLSAAKTLVHKHRSRDAHIISVARAWILHFVLSDCGYSIEIECKNAFGNNNVATFRATSMRSAADTLKSYVNDMLTSKQNN